MGEIRRHGRGGLLDDQEGMSLGAKDKFGERDQLIGTEEKKQVFEGLGKKVRVLEVVVSRRHIGHVLRPRESVFCPTVCVDGFKDLPSPFSVFWIVRQTPHHKQTLHNLF